MLFDLCAKMQPLFKRVEFLVAYAQCNQNLRRRCLCRQKHFMEERCSFDALHIQPNDCRLRCSTFLICLASVSCEHDVDVSSRIAPLVSHVAAHLPLGKLWFVGLHSTRSPARVAVGPSSCISLSFCLWFSFCRTPLVLQLTFFCPANLCFNVSVWMMVKTW